MEREQLKPTCKELSYDDIKKVISHRFPFLLVDKILKVEENQIVGMKNVSGTDPYLQGHFPEKAVYPGVLLIESCAQVGGILVGKLIKGTGYLARVVDFKFTEVIVPGDSIIITARYHSKLQKFIQVDCDAEVDGKLVGKGKIVYSFM
ncbi:3-hydroxyacyl-ACP dehydratase FabZ [Maribacter sp. M208]|uniref:3-hydroxyacyl-ACP dehydratase FabZ n=1 Tax=Maribacter huludaoensis TaxID=3030010 RepID=UPI0023EBEBEA|nr:3-hydroxyacyl-ACP dehydratase FabZ [Maribacter huludaoensis]MDF4221062.1 3-hydroxyacyl-ACP dehydratase FabZ [Maribacter huludaoensis]